MPGPDHQPLPSRLSLVTGCDAALGQAIAARLVQAGWPVYAAAIDPSPLQQLRDLGCRTVRLDPADPAAAEALVRRIEHDHGAVGVLVLTEADGPLRREGLPDTLEALAQPAMEAQGWGRVVRISGTSQEPRQPARSSDGPASGIDHVLVQPRRSHRPLDPASCQATAAAVRRALEARQPRPRYRVGRLALLLARLDLGPAGRLWDRILGRPPRQAP